MTRHLCGSTDHDLSLIADVSRDGDVGQAGSA
jgi:hypothetical protein